MFLSYGLMAAVVVGLGLCIFCSIPGEPGILHWFAGVLVLWVVCLTAIWLCDRCVGGTKERIMMYFFPLYLWHAPSVNKRELHTFVACFHLV